MLMLEVGGEVECVKQSQAVTEHNESTHIYMLPSCMN